MEVNMNKYELETPCLIIDEDLLMRNLEKMQTYANAHKVGLRPHSKTHKMAYIVNKQLELGATGVTVAKISEAETLSKEGIGNIFIANEFMGKSKFKRLLELSKIIEVSFGVDSLAQLIQIDEVFSNSGVKANVLIEIEVGEKRSGVIEESDFVQLINFLKTTENIHYKGVFSHDGHSYHAVNIEACMQISLEAQKRTLHFAEIANSLGLDTKVVSIGSTPPHLLEVAILEGVTEIRPGTYALMDASQANVTGDYTTCAATILSTVISKPNEARVILDVGAKGLTMQSRHHGICNSLGLGDIKNYNGVYIHEMFDEHAIIYNKVFSETIALGEKIEIIPVHICPVCNLYDVVYFTKNDDVISEIPVTCRGKLT